MNINFSKTVGNIKPMHAVNNAPILGAMGDSMFHYVGEAGIPFSRLHDTGGTLGGGRFVDIPNIFRDFSADENDPSSYDFAFTDKLLTLLDGQKAQPFYRLGVTIENAHRIKAYNIYPPKDNAKWARICEKIIAHYNEGWANGYHLGIKYWEIWNEPDNEPIAEDNPMWRGSFEQYLDLYKETALHLKKAFPDIKIGGYASCGFYALFENNVAKTANSTSRTDYFIDCFERFLQFVSEHNLPFDFFSWHSYSDCEKNVAYEKYVREMLSKYGFDNTESILNEWNTGIDKRGTLEDSANISQMMLTMQNSTLDMLMYYDGQVHGDYQGLYNPITHTPFKAYYVFKAFNELYKLKNQVAVCNVPDGMCCVAAGDETAKAIMLTNKSGLERAVTLNTDCENTMYALRINNQTDLGYTEVINHGDSVTVANNETVLLTTNKPQ